MASRRATIELLRRKSDPGSCKLANEAVVAAELPWGALKVVSNMAIDFGILPAKFSAQSLLLELFNILEKKIQQVSQDDETDKLLNKFLRKGEDLYFDNLLRTLSNISETCLPSILTAIIRWYENQQKSFMNNTGDDRDQSMKQFLAAGYLFCILLIDLLPQVQFHPTECESSVSYILNLSFQQVVYREPAYYGINYNNSLVVSEVFAEVIGVLSQSHFKLVQKTFFNILNELRKETPLTSNNLRQIISLLMGMKFFRIKTNQVSDLEAGVNFLDELGSYYLEVDLKQKDLKQSIAGLLVEILLPVAAQIKTEANVPSLIAFVDKMYSPTYDLINKKQHKMAAYPLLTCLLCISQSKFFLSNWVQFLNTTLANLKNRDSKVSRVALESLYRLIWVYIIRNNCEGNTATRSRLESICSSLFPRGNRNVIPREAPLNIFVKIIHFIAQQKLDFAFKEIIFDLLGCNRASKSVSIYPERMNIGIRALMVIADGLQQKEGPPGMPRSIGPVASGTIQRVKKTYISRPLTADLARTIGLEQYYLPCRKAFDSILRTLDTQVGRCLMLTASQTRGKEPNELIVGDVKPKLDLFRTCIAAIPRLLPDPMSHHDLFDLLTRMSIHMDLELQQTVYQTIQNLISECPEWREDIIQTYLNFLTNQIQDTFPLLLDSSVRFLYQLICAWKSAVQFEKRREQQTQSQQHGITKPGGNGVQTTNPQRTSYTAGNLSHSIQTSRSPNHGHTSGAYSDGGSPGVKHPFSPVYNNVSAHVLHCVEGIALILLCQLKTHTKKLAIGLLKEVKSLLAIVAPEHHDSPVIDVLDDATPYVLNKYIEHVPVSERQTWTLDFASVCEKICNLEPDNCLVNSDKGNEYMRWDPWACALSGYGEYRFLWIKCPTAVAFAYPALFSRLSTCNQFVDPNNPQNESRASLLRSSKSKATSSSLCGESLTQDSYLSLWQKYLVLCCALAPPPPQPANPVTRSFSPSTTMELDLVRNMTSSLRLGRLATSSANCTLLFQKIWTMIRWEQMTDMRDSVVLGLGSTNPACIEYLLDELSNRGVLRECLERKPESNVRRRKRKDLLRLQVLRIIEIAVFRGAIEFGSLLDAQTGQLSQITLEILDSIRYHVEFEHIQDRDMATLTSLRLHFAKTLILIIDSVPLNRRSNLLSNDRKYAIFSMLLPWYRNSSITTSSVGVYVEQKAVQAMCSLLCSGPMFSIRPSNDDDYVYRFIELLFSNNNLIVNNICEDTLSTMLYLNEDENIPLFDWTIQMCYVKPTLFATRCFKSLAMLFSQREFACDFIPIFVLCQVFVSDSDLAVREAAFLLIHVLRRQFFNDNPVSSSTSEVLNDSRDVSIKMDNEHNVAPKLYQNTQYDIIKQLARTYPQLTMPIFSEVCSRIESAKHRQSAMLAFLVSWLDNIELVDPHCEIFGGDLDNRSSHGWGSEEATQLLLNNLLYLTVKFSSEHNYEIMELWKTLVSTYSSNLPTLVHYLFVMMSLSPDTLVPVAKRISEYLLAATGERFVMMLMDQLYGVGEQFKMILTRSEMPPYYRWQPTNSESDENIDEKDKSKAKSPQIAEEKVQMEEAIMTNQHNDKKSAPRQLPMPAYGGFYANLSTLLPHSTQPVLYFTRHNLALFLMSDLIGFAADKASSIDWECRLVQLLHLSLLGLDSTRPIVCRYSRRSLINLCLLYAGPAIQMDQVASILLTNELFARNEVFEKYPRATYQIGSSYNMSNDFSIRPETPTFAILSPDDCRKALLFSSDIFDSSTKLLCSICCLLSDKPERWLWNNEEVSSRYWRIESAEQLGCFVGHLVEFFVESVPLLPAKWTEFGMKLALSTNSRHVAGRSFQIVSALGQNLTPRIGQMLSRLVEIVGEHSEDAQCYITHMLLCIMALVPAFQFTVANENNKPPTSPTGAGHNRSISYTPALVQQNAAQGQKQIGIPSTTSPTHSNYQLKKDARHSLLIENEVTMFVPPQLSRSKSATTLKLNSLDINEEQTNAISQLLAITLALMESHVDNEFLLGLNLFEKLIDTTANEKEICLQRLEKLINQLDWNGFPGLVGLIAKGSVYSSGYEISISLLSKCIDLLNLTLMGTVDTFTNIVISILPYCLHNFDAPSPVCIASAQAIAKYCDQKLVQVLKDSPGTSPNDHPLQNLATMMNQYQERSFPLILRQPCTTDILFNNPSTNALWAKCVANYLIDAFQPRIVQNIVFMAEMLEKTIPQFHVYLLHMIYLFISHGDDLNDASPVPINGQVLRVVTKHIQGINWREAARIFKCVVDQWNSISITQVLGHEIPVNQTKPNFELYVERPTFEEASPQTPRRMTSTQLAANNIDSLRRQNASTQSKVRERLISLLTASGVQVGLPKSSSMIFSQSTNDIYHETTVAVGGTSNINIKTGASNSAYSSSERISHQDDLESGSSLVAIGVEASSITTDSFPRVFKEFDFLEAEHDSISESNESCFNWLSTLRSRCELDQNEEAEDGVVDEHEDDFLNPGEDEEDEDDVDLRAPGMGRGIRMRSAIARRGGRSIATHPPRRPLSGASDSNDISSDRTPVQSDSSPALTDEEEDHEIDEDLEAIVEDESKKSQDIRVPSSLAESTSTYPLGADDTIFASVETASSVQCRSEFSIQHGNNYSQNRPPIYLECNHHISGQVDQVWVSFVNDIANDQEGGTTSHSIMLFSQLFRECCVKLSSLLRDACHCINMSGNQQTHSPRDLSAYFTQALNVVLKVADCPILFVTPQFLHSSNLLQVQKFSLYELLEHYETFIERKEQCIRALNAVKSALKLMLLSPTSSTTSIGGVSQEVELCKSLHKLFFQLLLMLEKLNDMIKAITNSTNSQEFDLSPAVLCLHRELLGCTSELPPSELRMSSHSLSVSRTDQSVDTLVLHLTNKNYRSALTTLRVLRNQFGSNQYGCCDHVDIEVLLIQFCRAHTMRTWAIVGSMAELQRNCTSLRQICGTLSALVRTLLSDVGTGSLRSSRLSSVNESSGMNTT